MSHKIRIMSDNDTIRKKASYINKAGMHICHNKIKGSHSRNVKPKRREPESVQERRSEMVIGAGHTY